MRMKLLIFLVFTAALAASPVFPLVQPDNLWGQFDSSTAVGAPPFVAHEPSAAPSSPIHGLLLATTETCDVMYHPCDPPPDVPEPGTLVLTACGLVGFGIYRRRKSHTKMAANVLPLGS